jgi:hypothetical protein
MWTSILVEMRKDLIWLLAFIKDFPCPYFLGEMEVTQVLSLCTVITF